ncbi:replication endonuclease [Pseudidiomarina homiensis]|uniref:Replication gene A protein-like domain-containing protein n=1 Tax=Pseudidiomarina homiensis TaxID=364198 RepID=A0A432XUH1_9GAMM|nr:replication endonuclease [Pseudidiomarina homiensis]RUO52372.1 hypothetical protein CWI70_11645 [Pseudidiomarina homiensis]
MNQKDMQRLEALYPDLVPFSEMIEIDDAKFILQKLSVFPRPSWPRVLRRYRGKGSKRERNLFLYEFAEETRNSLPSCIKSLDIDSEEINTIAKYQLGRITEIAKGVLYEVEDHFHAPYTYTGRANSDKILYTSLRLYMERLRLIPPDAYTHQNFASCIRKMLCIKTWRRQLHVELKRAREKFFISLGEVNQSNGLYISNFGAEKRKHEKIANQEFLASTYMKNSKGEIFSLLKLSNATVANPINRRNELMARLAGAEQEANRRGDIGLFLTITCPSRFHSTLSTTGQQNPKWDGSTPKQASQYLSKLWQKIRAALSRQQIRIYGIRISEPQHDATPHWHMLVFVAPEYTQNLIETAKEYALQDSPNEPGATKYRFDVEIIDKRKGTATSYIAKYISKNIDGFGLEHVDNEILIKAFRVEAWASCWGIRQFQSFGMPSITGWREIRKVERELPESSPFHLTHKAADSGDFAGYIRAMGGVCIPAKERSIKLLYDAQFAQESGEVKLSQYTHEPVFKVVGLQAEGKRLLTRSERWQRCSETGAA